MDAASRPRGIMKTFAFEQRVEFCPDAVRDTATARWRPGIYVWPNKGLPGWHLVREPTGNIVNVPDRRIRGMTS